MILKGKIIDKIMKSSEMIHIDPSRCSRMRYNKNSCEKCLKSCDTGAISIDNRLVIHRDTCSECMLCVSECFSDALGIYTLDFYAMTARLRRIQSPVISCGMKTDLSAHEKTPCLGFLSEEHIIALLVFLPGNLQINLTKCTTCRNGFIVNVLRKRLERIEARIPMKALEKIILAGKSSDLNYEDISYDRRGFFKALKDLSTQKTASLLDDPSNNKPPEAYSSKNLPVKRELLNRVLPVVSGKVYQGLLRNYYYNVTVDKSCNNCFACVAMCPTGALRSYGNKSDTGLLFNTSRCSGCGLCASFCRNNSVLIEEGFSGDSPFQFIRLIQGLTQHPHGEQSLSLNEGLSDHP